MDETYRIIESVGHRIEKVHDYESLEKHHPTQPEDFKRRHYGDIDGEREEFVYSPTGERMVSKDFVLLVDGDAHVNVPSPVSGFARRSERLDRWGTVEIYDGLGDKAHLIARVRHMDPFLVADGERVEYGQPLGRQGSKAPLGKRVGLHTHMDVSESHLGNLKAYIRDINAGCITAGGLLKPKQSDSLRETSDARVATPRDGENGHEIRAWQHALNKLGYHDAQGRSLVVDGDIGHRTHEAVKAFQQAHDLRADGVIDKGTRDALRHAQHAPSPRDPCHPDHLLYRQTLVAVDQLERGPGRDQDAAARTRMAASLTLLARENGLSRVDHLVLSAGNGRVGNGENVFVVQGRLDDPAHRRAHMKTQVATDAPTAESFHKLESFLTRQHTQAVSQGLDTSLRHVPMQHSGGYHEGSRLVPPA